jgi:WD40 repeat protein
MCVAFSPDSKILYTGGTDGKVPKLVSSWKAWDATSGRLLHTQKCPLTSNNALAVSPDGHRLATGGGEGAVRLWTLPKGFRKSEGKVNGTSYRLCCVWPWSRSGF